MTDPQFLAIAIVAVTFVTAAIVAIIVLTRWL
jgi:hypothetical protein